MRLGLSLTTFTPDPNRPLAKARQAASAGYDGVFAADHLFPPGHPERPAQDAFMLLSAAAATSPELSVGVLVTRALYRPVGLLAKLVANLDEIAGAGAILGLGLGDENGKAEHERLGLEYPPAPERAVALEETALALRALFDGRRWEGGEHVPPLEGPLLPPSPVPVWIGGASDRVLAVAARAADSWNGWGLTAERFAARAATLAELVVDAGRAPGEVPPTWAGIALVGEHADELAALEEERAGKGLPMDIWRGTKDDLRAFAADLERAGAEWLIVLPAGPADRTDLIAATLRSR